MARVLMQYPTKTKSEAVSEGDHFILRTINLKYPKPLTPLLLGRRDSDCLDAHVATLWLKNESMPG